MGRDIDAYVDREIEVLQRVALTIAMQIEHLVAMRAAKAVILRCELFQRNRLGELFRVVALLSKRTPLG